IEEVAALFDGAGARLVTLTGPGGIGKTSLALAVGERLRHRFGANIAFVDVGDLTRPEQALARLSRAVHAGPGGSALDTLVERLGDGPCLLILDGLEQLVEVAFALDELL